MGLNGWIPVGGQVDPNSMVYVIQVCRQHSSRTRMELSSIPVLLESCLQTCITYTITEYKVNKLLMMDRRTVRNM